MFLAIDGIDPFKMDVGQAGLIALVCVIIVFGMLAILWGVVSLFKLIPHKAPKTESQPATKASAPVQKSAIKLEDIKDEDMMVAALVASIDYHEEVKEDVKVVSIKEL